MKVSTRFAPSPTGMLHIGGVRTALFNYMFAKKHKGKVLLRIEDTDKVRSSKESIDVILNGMQWLGLNFDDKVFYQSHSAKRHLECAEYLVEKNLAYRSFDRASKEAPDDFAIKLRIPEGKTIVKDVIHGDIEFDNQDIGEDIVLVRSNGEPTYMFSVVVDDIDMGITHVIRGDDHLSNTPKQILIYNALSKPLPIFAHIPLIHDIDGSKMSKRHGAVAIQDYKSKGYLPDAIISYLLELGWSAKNKKDIINLDEMCNVFDLKDVNKSSSRFDMEKLNHINLQYIKSTDNKDLLLLISDFLKDLLNREITEKEEKRIIIALDECKKQSTLKEVANLVVLFINGYNFQLDSDAKIAVNNKSKVRELISFIDSMDFEKFQDSFKEFLSKKNYKFSDIGPILRAMLIGKTSSVGLNNIFKILGKEETLRRIDCYR